MVTGDTLELFTNKYGPRVLRKFLIRNLSVRSVPSISHSHFTFSFDRSKKFIFRHLHFNFFVGYLGLIVGLKRDEKVDSPRKKTECGYHPRLFHRKRSESCNRCLAYTYPRARQAQGFNSFFLIMVVRWIQH